MKKATFGGVTKHKTPSEQNCSTVFVRIFVNRLSVERNHSLSYFHQFLLALPMITYVPKRYERNTQLLPFLYQLSR
jgi:hypothetical protein